MMFIIDNIIKTVDLYWRIHCAKRRNTIQDAIALYNENKYKEAVELCLKLKEDDVDVAELNLIMAKSILNLY